MHRPVVESSGAAGILPTDGELLQVIEHGADQLLETVGLRFVGDIETLDLWRGFGGIVDAERVYLNGAELRRQIRSSAPPNFVLAARNPMRSTLIGPGAAPVFAPIYGAPNVFLRDGRRCAGSLQLYRDLVGMAHSMPGIANTGCMICVPEDVDVADRPLVMAAAHLIHSDKPFMGSVASADSTQQVIDTTAQAVDGVTHARSCCLLHLINSTPPLTFQENPLRCLRVAARNRQACMITSYMMMGASSPVTTVGTLIQGYAETLAGIALTQLWSPGSPVVLGLVAVPFSMRTMLPCYGDPVSHQVQRVAVLLARHLGIPARGDGGVTSSKIYDAQAGYEAARATAMCVAAGADFMLHSAGALENLRCVSIEKFKQDAANIESYYGSESRPCADPVPLDREVLGELRAKYLM